jgi:4'-phosphopantetheinyl transferase
MALRVDLFFWPLTAPGTGLSADEETRAERFVQPRDAARYRAARGGLRRVLAGYTGQRPGDLRFDYGPQGKPFLTDGPAFNLSHAGGWAALAVAHDTVDLGLDIEAHRPVEPAVAERFFAPAEIAALAPLSGAAWQVGFFRLWTRKEAVIKALGTGLSHPLDAFDVTLGPEARLSRIEGGRVADWLLQDLGPGAGMQGAVAVRAAGRTLETRLCEGQLPLPG